MFTQGHSEARGRWSNVRGGRDGLNGGSEGCLCCPFSILLLSFPSLVDLLLISRLESRSGAASPRLKLDVYVYRICPHIQIHGNAFKNGCHTNCGEQEHPFFTKYTVINSVF